MPDDADNPLEEMQRTLRRRHPTKDLEFDVMPGGGDWEDKDADQWMTIDADGKPLAGVDYKPKTGAYGVTRPNADGGYPTNPDKMFEGERAYDDALGEVEGILADPNPMPKRRL